MGNEKNPEGGLKDICDPKFELAKQLHEQLATNYNASVSNFVSFFIGVVAICGAWWTAFTDYIPLEKYWILSLFVSGLILFLTVVAINFGYAFRRDQYIVQKIRREYGLQEVLGDLYKADNKCCCTFLPSLYDAFYWLFVATQIALIVTDLIFQWECNRLVVVIFIIRILFFLSAFLLRRKTYTKYEKNCKHIDS